LQKRVEVLGQPLQLAQAALVGFSMGMVNPFLSLLACLQERVKVFGQPLQLTQAALLGSVIGIGLKSLLECIRMQTLGRAGLQQLQLDCHYLRPLLCYPGGRVQQVCVCV
jgi:hypothetical protein